MVIYMKNHKFRGIRLGESLKDFNDYKKAISHLTAREKYVNKLNHNTPEHWDAIWSKERRTGPREEEIVRSLLGKYIVGDVLEIGGGFTNFQTEFIARKLGKEIRSYTSVDLSEMAKVILEEKIPEAKGVVHDIESRKPIPLPDHSYDTIMLIHSLEHFEWETAQWLVSDLERLIRKTKEAYIIIEVPPEGRPTEPNEHRVAYGGDEKKLRELFEPRFEFKAVAWTDHPRFVVALIRKTGY